MPSSPPVSTAAAPPKRVRRLRPVGATLAVVGTAVLGATALVTMLTVMSHPTTPWVGFVPGPDGTPTVVVQRSGATGVTGVQVRVSDTDQTVLWGIDRLPGSSWDGTVVLGDVPKGFVASTARQGAAIPGGAVVVVTNGCYASYASVPDGPLTPGVVTTDDEQVGLDEFSSSGGAFTPCGDAQLRTLRSIAAGGLVLLSVGVGALVASIRRRPV